MASRQIQPKRSSRAILSIAGDKSISHRAAIFGSISEGVTTVENFLTSDDCLNTVNAMRMMGVAIEREGATLSITGVGLDGLRVADDVIDVGNSGTGIRLLTGLVAGQKFNTVLTGDASIRRRPMDRIIQPLRQMGATIHGEGGDRLAPLRVTGSSLNGTHYRSPVASAQVKSCVLIAGLYANGETTETEPSLSRDHTERMLMGFGATVTRDGLTVTVAPRPSRGMRVTVPGDISSAAFFIVAGLILPDAEIVIENVGVNPTRDGIIEALKAMGADITLERERVMGAEPVADLRVKSSELSGAEFGGDLIVRMIDEIPILALAASQASGTTVVRDAEELRVKETDRIATISSELAQLGVQVVPSPDGFTITGKQKVRGGACSSRGDHRIAMTAAVAGLVAETPVTVSEIECIYTSFPTFWEVLSQI